jgi:methylenetetrahydrofolate dehydrogenase (NADP+) / methenyltetrahydrofolate cyclohydrolase
VSRAVLLKGRDIADALQRTLAEEAAVLKKKYAADIKIVAVSVGKNEGSNVYLKSQERAATSVGIRHEVLELPADIALPDLLENIERLNRDSAVSGVIVQMPLPEHLPVGKVLGALDPAKDIEGVHADNLGLLVLRKGHLAPCTPLAVMKIIEAAGIDLYGAEAVVVGSSTIVGRPLALLLMDALATTTICTIATSEKNNLEAHVRRAEVLVVAAGVPELIPGEWIKPGAVVIDVGINRVDGKIVGDVAFDAAQKRAAFITPVPGGIGPLTVTLLMQNALIAFNLQKERDENT